MEGGSNTQVTFVGHRTAFSCIGRVKTLVGEGVGDITVKVSNRFHCTGLWRVRNV